MVLETDLFCKSTHLLVKYYELAWSSTLNEIYAFYFIPGEDPNQLFPNDNLSMIFIVNIQNHITIGRFELHGRFKITSNCVSFYY